MILGSDTNEKAKKEIHCSGSGIYIGHVCVNRRYICSQRESGTAEQDKSEAQCDDICGAYKWRAYRGIGVTDTLKQVVISDDGNINRFYDVAANMMDDSIQSIQIAPNGVVTEIYPEEGNESGKIDLINDSDRGEISRYARDNDTVIMQGPLELKQGGYGIAVRNPVYLEDENGQKSFWGFTIVILKVPEIFLIL